jgi:hypothetical protein
MMRAFARTFVGVGLVIVPALLAGCASARRAADPVSAAVRVPEDLAGTWRGSHWRVAGSLYANAGNWVLRINDDGTFAARVTRAPAANNRASADSWHGTVDANGDSIVLRSDARWSSVTLMSDEDILYGVTTDPGTGAPVQIQLRRSLS